MSGEATRRPLEPVRVGSNWVLPTLEGRSNGQVLLHLSIAVSSDDELTGSDIGVRLTAGAKDLRQSEGPDPSRPLPVIRSRGATALAQYAFANPGDLVPTGLSVTLKGSTAEFSLEAPHDREA